MRLSDAERQGLTASCLTIASDIAFSLYLFGSRVNDLAKGGDIDLLLVVPPEQLTDLRMKKHLLLREMKDRIGDQKIDLIITTPQDLAEDAFLSSIKGSLALLYAHEPSSN